MITGLLINKNGGKESFVLSCHQPNSVIRLPLLYYRYNTHKKMHELF